MKPQLRFMAAEGLLVILCSVGSVMATDPGQSKPAQVKKKSGEIVEGTIKGMVVQREKKSVEDTKPETSVRYSVTRGEDVASIDEGGLQAREGSLFLVFIAGEEGSQPGGDLEVVARGLQSLDGALAQTREGAIPTILALETPSGGQVIGMYGKGWNGVHKGKVIGEYREEGGKPRLVPSIELSTGSGVVVVQASDVVDIKE